MSFQVLRFLLKKIVKKPTHSFFQEQLLLGAGVETPLYAPLRLIGSTCGPLAGKILGS
jgi:hypothetical protein